jgi:hypothetical protein
MTRTETEETGRAVLWREEDEPGTLYDPNGNRLTEGQEFSPYGARIRAAGRWDGDKPVVSFHAMLNRGRGRNARRR